MYIRPPRTPSRRSSFFAADGRAGTDSSIRRHAETVAHHFNAICDGGGGVCREPRVTTSFGPQRELPLARLVIHRQTSARARRKETLGVQPRSGILALFFTQQHWLRITVEFRITSEHHGEDAAWGGGGGATLPCQPIFGLGTTPP